jgi:hypothetical protein
VFALVKTVPAATDAYRHALGALQWVVAGAPAGGPVPVEAVTDPTDLVALPFIALSLFIASRAKLRAWRPSSRRGPESSSTTRSGAGSTSPVCSPDMA